MNSFLPPMRALQAFEAVGRLGSVNEAARELGVTPGAISQQIKKLEIYIGITLILRDGRGTTLGPDAKAYHEFVSQGFETLRQAQYYLERQKSGTGLTISALPSLLLKWLNPHLHRFQPQVGDVSVRMEATHTEPDPHLLDGTFRLTYGNAMQSYPYSRVLFTDTCFPVCSPEFLSRNPGAQDPARLAKIPLIEIDWGLAYGNIPHWSDWFKSEGFAECQFKPVAVYSLSGLALEAAVNGQGVTLAQAAFVADDLRLNRLVRLSTKELTMPEPYFICWGQKTMGLPVARDFLNWVLTEAKELQVSSQK